MDTPSHTALGREILSTVRSDLYLSLRFLDAALSGLTFEMSPLIPSSATDGERLYFQPHYLFRSYDENPVLVNRAFLHNLLHCLFSHLYLEPARNRELWDLCCDICTESILDSLDVPCLRKIPSSLREETYRFIQDNQITLLTCFCWNRNSVSTATYSGPGAGRTARRNRSSRNGFRKNGRSLGTRHAPAWKPLSGVPERRPAACSER